MQPFEIYTGKGDLDPMATIKDVAKKSGFSICTVSRALSGKGYLKEETRQKIMQAVEELNYHPNALAANLKTGRRQTLALILPSLTNISYTKLEKYMESYASEKGYLIYLSNSDYSLDKEKQIIDTLIGMDIAGVIIAPATNEHAHIQKLSEVNIPYVYLNRNFEDDPEHCIRVDNETAAYDAAKYIIKQGHRNIGGIFQSFEDSIHQEQYKGMMKAMEEHGIPCAPEKILFDVNPEDANASRKILRLLQTADRPEVIFTDNDMTAFSVYRAAYILGLRIPEQLSVFGYDDCTMANFVTPPLSTVSVPSKKMAAAAIDFIHHFLETGEIKELPVLKAAPVIRNSVKKIHTNEK